MTHEKTLEEKLSRIVEPRRIRTDRSYLDEVSWDALSDGRIHPLRRPQVTLPRCVVLPISTVEVREVVLLANTEKVPIVPYGGGSGLMGGALSIQPGLVLDLRQMDSILEIDKEARTSRVQAGVVLESLEKALNENGLILGHDPWTLPVATVGGAISTDSMGYRGGKYGSMGDQILSLVAVLPNGEILRTRAVPKSSTGIDLKQLFIGGEGCFGIITEATVKAFPLPAKRSLHSLRFASFEEGFSAVQKIFARGLRPALMDFGDAGTDADRGAVLYLAFEGAKAMVEAEEHLALTICKEEKGERLPEEEAQDFWRQRHAIAYRFMHNRRYRRERGKDTLCRDWIHVALPASQVLPFRKAAMETVGMHGVVLQESGLWTQPELFSMRLAVENQEVDQPQKRLEEAIDELLQLVQRMGGSMEYCHGVGVKLASLMAGEHGYGLEVMRQIKRVLDPNHIMNPGKLGL